MLFQAAEIRRDIVFKRLQQLEEQNISTFCYHPDNRCYKTYVMPKTLDSIQNERVAQPAEEGTAHSSSEDGCNELRKILTRSQENSSRNAPCKFCDQLMALPIFII